MDIRILSGALALVFLSAGSVRALADTPAQGEKVSPPAKVLPFAEDEREPAKNPKPAPPKSNFQPKFRPPAVRQSQPEEQPAAADAVTVSDTKKGEVQTADFKEVDSKPAGVQVSHEEPTDELVPIPRSENQPADMQGRSTIDEAFELSKTAKTDADYTRIIELCRRSIDTGLRKNYENYAKDLMSWSYNRRGESRAVVGKDVEAMADFETAVELNPSAWRAVHNRGVSFAAQGRIAEALADFDRTIELKKDYPNAYFNRGELRYLKKDYGGAIGDYTSAIKLNPSDAATFNSRGHALYRLERFGEALRDYGEAIKRDPENAAALIHRGDVYCDLGQYAEAAKDYRAAVKVAPELGRAYQSAAWLMATCPDQHYRHETLAIDAAKKAIELGGEQDYRAWETLAAAQASAGAFDEAKVTQEKAISLAPKSEVVAAEKRMGLYQRDLAFRDRPRTSLRTPEDDFPVKQASGIMTNVDTTPDPEAPYGRSYSGQPFTSPPPTSQQPRGLSKYLPGRNEPPAATPNTPAATNGQPRGLLAPQSPNNKSKKPATMAHPLGRN